MKNSSLLKMAMLKSLIHLLNMVDLSIAMLVYQRVKPIEIMGVPYSCETKAISFLLRPGKNHDNDETKSAKFRCFPGLFPWPNQSDGPPGRDLFRFTRFNFWANYGYQYVFQAMVHLLQWKPLKIAVFSWMFIHPWNIDKYAVIGF